MCGDVGTLIGLLPEHGHVRERGSPRVSRGLQVKTDELPSSVKASHPVVGSGDDLLDDFGELEPVLDDEEGSGKPKKKKKKTTQATAADWFGEGAVGPGKGDKKGKEPKVVNF